MVIDKDVIAELTQYDEIEGCGYMKQGKRNDNNVHNVKYLSLTTHSWQQNSKEPSPA